MIEFENVVTDSFGPISFRAAAGDILKVVALSRDAASGCAGLASGLIKPISGRALLFGQDINAITEEEYVALMGRVGLVTETGGMISNLKAGENVMLPVLYRGGANLAGLEALTEEAFDIAGVPLAEGKAMMSLPPARLKPFQSRILRMIRAFSTNPDLMLYEEIAGGLTAEMAKNVIEWAERFHRRVVGRVSVFITSHERTLKALPSTATIFIGAPEGDEGNEGAAE